MRKFIGVKELGIALSLAVLAVGFPMGSAFGENPAPVGAEGSFQPELLEWVNQGRSEARDCGDEYFAAAPPLEWNHDLARAALDHSNDIATHRHRGHTGTDGTSLRDRVNRYNPAMGSLGETIQYGNSSPEGAVQRLLRSPGHCRIIMGSHYTAVGGALSHNDTGYPYWVLVFGRAPESRDVQKVESGAEQGEDRRGESSAGRAGAGAEEEDPIAMLRESGVKFVFQVGAGFGMNESRAAGGATGFGDSFLRHRFTLGVQVLGPMNPENLNSTADLGIFGDFGFASGRGVRDLFPATPVMYDEEYQRFWNLEAGGVFLQNLPLIALRLSGGAGVQEMPTSVNGELLITATGGVVMNPGSEYLHAEILGRGYWSGLSQAGWELSGRVGVVWGF